MKCITKEEKCESDSYFSDFICECQEVALSSGDITRYFLPVIPLPLSQELYWDWLDSATDESASLDCQSLDAASDVCSTGSCGPSHVGTCLMWSSGSNPQLQLEGSSFWPNLLSLGIDEQAITWYNCNSKCPPYQMRGTSWGTSFVPFGVAHRCFALIPSSASVPFTHLWWEEYHAVGTLHSLQWLWYLFPPIQATQERKALNMLPSASRENVCPEPPPSALGTDKRAVVGLRDDRGFCLGQPEPHLGTRMWKESCRQCKFESVSGVVSSPDGKRFDQRMSSFSSELTISPAGALIWVTISNDFSTCNLCYTVLYLFIISCVEDIQSSSFWSVVGRACFP